MRTIRHSRVEVQPRAGMGRRRDSGRLKRVGGFARLAGLALLIGALAGCAAAGAGTTAPGHAHQHLLYNNRRSSLPRPDSTLPISTYTGNTAWPYLRIGECVDDLASGNYRTIFGLDVVKCSQPHDSEIYAMPPLGGPIEWPGTTSVDTQSDAVCNAAFARYVGAPVEQTQLDYSYYPPTQISWQFLSNRYALCIVFQDTRPTVGSVKQSAILGNLTSQ